MQNKNDFQLSKAHKNFDDIKKMNKDNGIRVLDIALSKPAVHRRELPENRKYRKEGKGLGSKFEVNSSDSCIDETAMEERCVKNHLQNWR